MNLRILRHRAWIAGSAALLMVAGCTGSGSTLTYTPYTGVDVPTQSIIAAAGIGCGSTPDTIDHYAAILTYASDARAPTADTALSSGVFACFVANGVFQNVDASASFDVWVYAYPAGLPPAPDGAPNPDLSCDAGTCTLTAQDLVDLLEDQTVPGRQALRTVLCTAMTESGQHPTAYGCVLVSSADASAEDSGTVAP